jgi:hypothetical protein
LNGVFPVLQSDAGRYSVEVHRLPEIAEALGLPLAADTVSEAV